MALLPVTAAVSRRAEGETLTSAETTRYSRHLLLPEVGADGQKRLKASRILVIGAGGLGSPVSLYLTAAGVGTIGLVDHDTVDTSNLQRQILYKEADAGRSKAVAARERLQSLSSAVNVEVHEERLDATNAERLLSAYDVIVDGTDNFPTRYLVNDACVFLGKPNVYGSIFRFDGQASVFYPPHGPCYRCLFPSPPPAGQVPSCAEGGVLGVLPAQIGAIQATEALKLVLGIGEPLLGRLLTLDALSMKVDEFKVRRDDDCPVCGKAPTITSLVETPLVCEVPAIGAELAVATLKSWRDTAKPHLLVDVRSAAERAICAIEGSTHMPVSDIAKRVAELPRDRPVVLHCKSGARSLQALQALEAQGLTNAMSLKGGILHWIDEIEPFLSKY